MKGMVGLEALRTEAKGLGFICVQTLGGPVPLKNWIPYGQTVLPRIEFATWWILGETIHEGQPSIAGPFGQGVWGLIR